MGKELGDLFNCLGCMAKCQDQEKEAVGREGRGRFKRQMWYRIYRSGEDMLNVWGGSEP